MAEVDRVCACVWMRMMPAFSVCARVVVVVVVVLGDGKPSPHHLLTCKQPRAERLLHLRHEAVGLGVFWRGQAGGGMSESGGVV